MNPIEHKMLLLLGMNGIDKRKISFKTSSAGDRFFSYGYCNPIKISDVEYLKEHCQLEIEEISRFDNDFGWQYFYRFDS